VEKRNWPRGKKAQQLKGKQNTKKKIKNKNRKKRVAETGERLTQSVVKNA